MKTVNRDFLPIGSNPYYDRIVNRGLKASTILSKEARGTSLNEAFVNYESKAELKNLLEKTIEKRDGLQHLLDGKSSANDGFERAFTNREKFLMYSQKLINEGRAMPGKVKEPENLRDERYTLMANIFIKNREVELLTKLFENYVEKKSTEDEKAILRFGVRGMGKIRHSVLVLMDGMKVTASQNGFRIINSPSTPFHQLSTYDYITMYKEHAVAQSQLNNKLAPFKSKLQAVKATPEETKIGIADKTKEILKLHPEWNLNKIKWHGKLLPDPEGFERHQLNGKPEVKPTEKTSVPKVTQKN